MEKVVFEASSVVKRFADKLALLTGGNVIFHLSFVIGAVVHDVETWALCDAVGKHGDEEGTVGLVEFAQFGWFASLDYRFMST